MYLDIKKRFYQIIDKSDEYKHILILNLEGIIIKDQRSLVREKGLEPPHLAAPGPKPGASTNSATLAFFQEGEFYWIFSCLCTMFTTLFVFHELKV